MTEPAWTFFFTASLLLKAFVFGHLPQTQTCTHTASGSMNGNDSPLHQWWVQTLILETKQMDGRLAAANIVQRQRDLVHSPHTSALHKCSIKKRGQGVASYGSLWKMYKSYCSSQHMYHYTKGKTNLLWNACSCKISQNGQRKSTKMVGKTKRNIIVAKQKHEASCLP